MSGKTIAIGDGPKGEGSLEVHIEGTGKSYRVPLAGSLTMGDAMTLRRVASLPKKRRDEGYFDAIYEIFCRYIPKKYIDRISMRDFERLSNEWGRASSEDGARPGE